MEAARLAETIEAEVREAIAAEEPVGPPPFDSMVEDVFAEVPWHLREQLAQARDPSHKR